LVLVTNCKIDKQPIFIYFVNYFVLRKFNSMSVESKGREGVGTVALVGSVFPPYQHDNLGQKFFWYFKKKDSSFLSGIHIPFRSLCRSLFIIKLILAR